MLSIKLLQCWNCSINLFLRIMSAILVLLLTVIIPSLAHSEDKLDGKFQGYDTNFNPMTFKDLSKLKGTFDLDPLIDEALQSSRALENLYKLYRQKHNVVHSNHETTQRLELFKKYLLEIQEIKAENDVTWNVGITFMGHMTPCERSLLSSVNETEVTSGCDVKERKIENNAVLKARSIPDEYDWRALGGVTSIKQQLGGNCWAYAVVTPMEAQIKYLTGDQVELSTQELADCVYYGTAHHMEGGGKPSHGWQYIMEEKKLGYRSQIPEREGFGSCSYGWAKNALKEKGVGITSWHHLRRANTNHVMSAISQVSPVSVVVDTNNAGLEYYTGGPFDPRKSGCRTGDKHAMSIVGYNQDLYFIKNSWGNDWGNDGYLWWDRKATGPNCNLYRSVMYPIVGEIKEREIY